MKNTKYQILNTRLGAKRAKYLILSTYLTATLVLLVFIGLFLARSARAQEMVRTFTIVPPAVQKNLKPGATTEGIMKVINDSPNALTFTVAVHDYIVVDTRGTPNILPENTLSKKYSASNWIAVYPNTFTVQPRQKQDLNYYVQIPADAAPGGHYAAVVFTPGNSDSLEGSGSSVNTRIGTLFYLTVEGQVTILSKITNFFANTFQEYGPIKIQTQIKNYSDVHIKPVGTILVSDLLGRTIEKTKLSEYNIFPESARDYENTIGQQWMLGRFKAKVVSGYGPNNSIPLVSTVYFWVFPWKVTVVVILFAIAIILGMKVWKKKKHNTQKDTEPNTDLTQNKTP